jgi:periplasmic copper chaperone A
MRNHIRVALVLALALLCRPLAGLAADGALTVEHPWARPAAVGQMGVIYLTVTDTGAPDQLIGVRTPVAADASLHESKMNGTVMEMRPVSAIPIAPGQPLVLAPGGYHIMLMGLKQALKEGDTVPVTLMFRRAGAVTAQAMVQRNAPKS